MRRTRTNAMPIATFSLRDRGPTALTLLVKEVGQFKYAHGKGTDRRATLDPTPCPACGGKVEWALTSRRDNGRKGKLVMYVYARCRMSPSEHRWDFRNWRPPADTSNPPPTPLDRPLPNFAHAAIPSPRPSVGADLMNAWLDRRMDSLSAELDRLSKIRQLATEVAKIEGMDLTGIKGGDHSPPRR